MKKIKLILLVIIIVFILINICNHVFALDSNLDEYDPAKHEEAVFNNRLISSTAQIVAVIRIIGVVVSVISLMIMGIKYMFASIEQKANYKQTMMPWAIGCIILAAGTTLIEAIYSAVH